MKTTMNYLMRRVALPTIISLGILLIHAPTARADKISYRPLVTNNHYSPYRNDRAYAMPHWIRQDRDFRRWFMRSRYRYASRHNWSGLHDLYAYERRINRERHRYNDDNRRYRGHVKTPRRRKH